MVWFPFISNKEAVTELYKETQKLPRRKGSQFEMCSIESVKMGNSELWEMLPISLQKT
jgi:hypothetical protein